MVHNNEFMGYEFLEVLDSYGIKPKQTTVKNPTANAIMEQIHETLGEQLRATVFGATIRERWLIVISPSNNATIYAHKGR